MAIAVNEAPETEVPATSEDRPEVLVGETKYTENHFGLDLVFRVGMTPAEKEEVIRSALWCNSV